MKYIHLFLVCMTLAAANFVSGMGYTYTYDFDTPPDVPTWNFPTSGSLISGSGLLNTSPSLTFAFGTYTGASPASSAKDMMIRSFGPAVGLTTANWTATVTANLSPILTVGASQKVSLFLAAANNDHAFAISLDKISGGTEANTYMDFVVNSGPVASAALTSLTLNYVSADKKIYALVDSSSVGSWDVAPYYGVEGSFFTFSLGGMSTGNLPVDFYSNAAYLDSFALGGTGIIAAGGPPVPEPSTYAAIMGVAALGAAAIRRRRISNTNKAA